MNAVILDIDGTLLESAEDDDRIYRESVAAVLGPVRFRSDLSDYDRVTDSGILEQLAADNGLRFDAELLFRVRQLFLARLAEYVERSGPFPSIPGAVGFIRRLRESPLASVAIATGGWGSSARFKLESARLPVEGIPLVSSDDAAARTDIMRIALDSLTGPFENIIYLGDGHWDRSATAELGWVFQPVGDRLGGIGSFEELPSLPQWRWLYDNN